MEHVMTTTASHRACTSRMVYIHIATSAAIVSASGAEHKVIDLENTLLSVSKGFSKIVHYMRRV